MSEAQPLFAAKNHHTKADQAAGVDYDVLRRECVVERLPRGQRVRV